MLFGRPGHGGSGDPHTGPEAGAILCPIGSSGLIGDIGVASLREQAVALPPEGDIVVVITGANMGREELDAFL